MTHAQCSAGLLPHILHREAPLPNAVFAVRSSSVISRTYTALCGSDPLRVPGLILCRNSAKPLHDLKLANCVLYQTNHLSGPLRPPLVSASALIRAIRLISRSYATTAPAIGRRSSTLKSKITILNQGPHGCCVSDPLPAITTRTVRKDTREIG